MLSIQNPMEDLEMPCSDCHNNDSWLPLKSVMIFQHDNTSFPLSGNHSDAECIQCHFGFTVVEKHDFKQLSSECFFCHYDIHQSSFGQNCEECHYASSWDLTQHKFDHDITLFPLVGAHRQIECSECHFKPLIEMKSNLTFSCSVCHFDVFTEAVVSISGHSENEDCIICHNTRAWVPSDMSNHDRLFPIYSGKHAGEWSTCEAECHINPTDYTDFSCGLNGVCHEHDQSKMDDEHQGEVSGYVYESQSCFQCHPRGDED